MPIQNPPQWNSIWSSGIAALRLRIQLWIQFLERWIRIVSMKIPLDRAILLGATILLLLRCYPTFTPMPSQINAHDEASYIQSGFDMAHGQLPTLANHPMVSILFAAACLVFQGSALWFIQSEWFIRFLLMVLLWISIWQLSRTLTSDVPEWSILALWALVLFPDRLTDNPSQLVFTILLTLAVWQCLLLFRRRKIRHALAVSLLLGLAFLTRDEGLWVWILTLPCVLLMGIQSVSSRIYNRILQAVTALVISAVPFFAVLLAYVSVYYFVTGSLDTRISDRTYDALEAGQGLSFPERYQGDLYISGIADAKKIYGDRSENGNSVVIAVLRHPQPMLERIFRNSIATVTFAIQGYGGFVGILILVFALGGCIQLIKEKAWGILSIFFSFSLYLILYIPFFWLTDYFLFIFPVTFFLTAKGIRAVLSGGLPIIWALLAIIIIIGIPAGLFTTSFRTAYFGLALLAFFAIAAVVHREVYRGPVQLAALGMVFLLMAKPTYATSPALIPDPRADYETQAAIWMMNNTQPTDLVAGWGATMPYMARRPFLSLEGYLNSPVAMYAWLQKNSIQYVYQNPDIRGVFPDVYQTIFDLETKGCLKQTFIDTSGTSRIFQIQVVCKPGP